MKTWVTAIAWCMAAAYGIAAEPSDSPEIVLWYGEEQTFGAVGHPTPTVNILGTITNVSDVAAPYYSVNGRGRRPFTTGPDLHRLREPGDFNIEVARDELRTGENTILLACWTRKGVPVKREVTVRLAERKPWPLPYAVDFTDVERLQDVVEVVDGSWSLTEQGVRTAAPYYDRVLAFGDSEWQDYELYAEVIIHRRFPPIDGRRANGPPYLSHVHTSFNLRWEGFPDDGFQPRRNWQAIGALVALRADLNNRDGGSYWWMHFGRGVPGRPAKRSVMTKDTRFEIPEGVPHAYRMLVETISDTESRYSTKVWPVDEDEPAKWQMVAIDGSESVRTGCVAFVVHHSDSTLRRIDVQPLDAEIAVEP